MKGMVSASLLGLILIGCAQHEPRFQVSGFEKQVLAFELASVDAGKPVQIHDLEIKFEEGLPSGLGGQCRRPENETPIIEIDLAMWNSLHEGGKEALIFHELGHCILHREHNDNVNAQSRPNSFMYPNVSTFSEFTRNVDYSTNRPIYITELFSKVEVLK